MAVDCYRNLISWEMVRHATHSSLLHCYSTQFAGPALLPSLGYLAKDFLTVQGEESLLAIKPGQSVKIPNDEITFLPFPMPEPPLAREMHEQEDVSDVADQIGRMRRDLLRIMKTALACPADFGVFQEILRKRRRAGDLEISAKLNRFARIRNKVEYRNHIPSSEERQEIRQIYDRVMDWAQRECAIARRGS